MASKAIYEADAKSLIYKFCQHEHLNRNSLLRVHRTSSIDEEVTANEWLSNQVKVLTKSS